MQTTLLKYPSPSSENETEVTEFPREIYEVC